MFHRGQGDISGIRHPWAEGIANTFAKIQLTNPFGGLSTQLLNPIEKMLKLSGAKLLIRGYDILADGISRIGLSGSDVYKFINNDLRFILGEKNTLQSILTTSPKNRNYRNKVLKGVYNADEFGTDALAILEDAPTMSWILGQYEKGLIKKYGELNKTFSTRDGSDKDLLDQVIRDVADRSPTRDTIFRPQGLTTRGIEWGNETKVSASFLRTVFNLQ